MGAPYFPYDGNTFMIETETKAEDGGFERIKKFVEQDPYVKNKLVSNYEIREFALKGATSDFDRLSSKFILRS